MDVDMMVMLPCFLELLVYFKSIATNYRSLSWFEFYALCLEEWFHCKVGFLGLLFHVLHQFLFLWTSVTLYSNCRFESSCL